MSRSPSFGRGEEVFMTDGRTNKNEGADPSFDIEKQNRDTPDGKAGGTGESRAGAGEGDDAAPDDTAPDNTGPHHSRAQDLAKAGREDFDPNAGQE